MRADTVLLHWLATHRDYRLQGSEEKGWAIWDVSSGLVLYAEGKTYREAIDNAITKETA